jgi:putative endonuclease
LQLLRDGLTPAHGFAIFPALKPMKTYSVYIMASKSRTLYTGVTSNLQHRVWRHRAKRLTGFSAKYNTTRLVYFEHFSEVLAAIQREKQIKGWLRSKKIALIESANRDWKDLSEPW